MPAKSEHLPQQAQNLRMGQALSEIAVTDPDLEMQVDWSVGIANFTSGRSVASS